MHPRGTLSGPLLPLPQDVGIPDSRPKQVDLWARVVPAAAAVAVAPEEALSATHVGPAAQCQQHRSRDVGVDEVR